MNILPCTFDADDPQAKPMGLIVLQADETIEPEFRTLFAQSRCPVYVSRIPSDAEVRTDTLARMEQALPAAAALLPGSPEYRVVGYACTSASSVIGSERVETLVRQGCNTRSVTNPLRAAIAHAVHLGVSKFALLSPYIEEVNTPLRAAFARHGISTEVFGSFGEAQEAKVARISEQSTLEAAIQLGSDPSVDAVFISCTNLRTAGVISKVAEKIGKPVLSSNHSLCWDMMRLNMSHF